MKSRLILSAIAVCLSLSTAALAAPLNHAKATALAQAPVISAEYNASNNATTVFVTVSGRTIAGLTRIGDIRVEVDGTTFVPTEVLAELRDGLTASPARTSGSALELLSAQMESYANAPKDSIPADAMSAIQYPVLANSCGDWRGLDNKCKGTCTTTDTGKCSGCSCKRSSTAALMDFGLATQPESPAIEILISTNTRTGETTYMLHNPGEQIVDETTSLATASSTRPPVWSNDRSSMFIGAETVAALRDAFRDKSSATSQAFTTWANATVGRPAMTTDLAAAPRNTPPGNTMARTFPKLSDTGCGDWKGLGGDCKGDCTSSNVNTCSDCSCKWTSLMFVLNDNRQ